MNVVDHPQKDSPLYNIPAEKAVLGTIFVTPTLLDSITLKSKHFSVPHHGLILEACRKLYDMGRTPDPVELRRLFGTAEMQEIGGMEYLGELARCATVAANAIEYAAIVLDMFHKRRFVSLSQQINTMAWSWETENDDIRAAIEKALEPDEEVGELARVGDHMDRVLEGIKERWRNKGELAGLSTSLVDLDERLGGLAAGDLIIIAGRPSMGKTALGQQIAEHNAAKGIVVAEFALEMSHDQSGQRMLARRTGIPITDLRRGRIDEAHFQPLIHAAADVRELPLYVDDSSFQTVAQIRAKCRRIKRRHGLGLVVIDYLQLIQAGDRYKGQKTQEVSEITRRLKGMAKELDIPVIALSQLSRNVENRDNKRPTLADLRDSGSIEQDADVVLGLFREEYYLLKEKPLPKADETATSLSYTARESTWIEKCEAAAGKADVIILKQRQGETGTVTAHWNGVRMMFGNADRMK